MKRKKAHIVYSAREIVPARAFCWGSNQDGNCAFAVHATRACPEIELRRMARTHAEALPGHVVRVEITDSTTYAVTD